MHPLESVIASVLMYMLKSMPMFLSDISIVSRRKVLVLHSCVIFKLPSEPFIALTSPLPSSKDIPIANSKVLGNILLGSVVSLALLYPDQRIQ